MSINPAFLEYFKSEFFSGDAAGFEAFQKSLLRPLKKTLRINTNKWDIGEFIGKKESVGWKFWPTPNGHVFHVDREDTTIALGSNPEHLRGDYYIQELSASMSVWLLADGTIHPEPRHILEIASSPGGKTTQIAEHYPNAFICANEFNKERIAPLLENIERMGLLNIAVTNMNGVQFRELPELFDLVLLDAPCSGEGIGYKAAESLRYWNIKNVRTIARLQKKLLLAGLVALKPGGTLVYSTCTLNRMENEEVLDAAREAFGDGIEVVFSKRFWPHTEIAGGFFVAKILKKLITDTSEPRQNDEIRSWFWALPWTVPTYGEPGAENLTRGSRSEADSPEPLQNDEIRSQIWIPKWDVRRYVERGTENLTRSSRFEEVPKGFKPNADIVVLSDRALATVENALETLGTELPAHAKLYRYKNDILLVRSVSDIAPILDRAYAIRFGMRIGRIEGNAFEPQAPLGVHFVHRNLPKIELPKELLRDFLRGLSVGTGNAEIRWLVQVHWNGSPLGFGTIQDGILKAQLPKYMFWK